MSLDFGKQLEINNIIDRLVRTKSEVFNADDARRLKYILVNDCDLKPANNKLTIWNPFSSMGFKGHAEGIGDINLQDDGKKAKVFGGHNKVVCGNWEITRGPDKKSSQQLSIGIRTKFDDTREPESTEEYTLEFDKKGEPTTFSEIEYRTIGNPNFFEFRYPKARVIKRASVLQS